MRKMYQCDMCGKSFQRLVCQTKGKKHLFCSRQCLADFSSKTKNPERYLELKDYTKMAAHFSKLAKERNPTKMTPEIREKIRLSRLGSGEGKSYEKTYGRHTHRVVAEQMLGRPLKQGEVVHHIDGNHRNNNPDNLRVFKSQKEHATFHRELEAVLKMLK